MKFWKTMRVKLFCLFVFVGSFPVILHLAINYYFYNDFHDPSFFRFLHKHVLFIHHTLFYEIGATLMVSFLIAWHITKPLNILNQITKQIHAKKFAQKIKIKSEDEIGKLSRVLNEMLEHCRNNQAMLGVRSQKILETKKEQREMINLFADVVYGVDENHRIIKAKNAKEFFGYEEKELIGKKSFDIIHPDDREKLKKALQKITPQKNKIIRDLKLRLVAKSGKVRYCLLSARTIFKKGEFSRREGVIRDITPREELAQKVLKEKEKLQQMYQNLHKSYLALGKINAQVAALAEINTTFSSNLDWKDKLHYIVESVRTFMKADETLLFVRDAEKTNFKLKYASIDFLFWEEIVLNTRFKLIKDLIHYRKPLKYFEQNTLLDKAKTTAKGYQAMLAIPVVINDDVIGVFLVFFKKPKALEDFPTKLSLAYTSQMSIALMMSERLKAKN